MSGDQISLLIDRNTLLSDGRKTMRWRQGIMSRRWHERGNLTTHFISLGIPTSIALLLTILISANDPKANVLTSSLMFLFILIGTMIVCMPGMIIYQKIFTPYYNIWFGEKDAQGKAINFRSIVPQYVMLYMAKVNDRETLIYREAFDEDKLWEAEEKLLDADSIRAFRLSTYNEWFEWKNIPRPDVPIILAEMQDGQIFKIAEHFGSQNELAFLHMHLFEAVLKDRPRHGYNAAQRKTAHDDDTI